MEASRSKAAGGGAGGGLGINNKRIKITSVFTVGASTLVALNVRDVSFSV